VKRHFVVLIDTREQKPWKLEHPSVRKCLDAGDYSLEGYEHKIRVERKGSANEFASNVGKDWPRFQDALRKLQRYPHRCIVCEFEMRDIFQENWRGRMTVDAVLGRLSEITLEMQIPVVFAGCRGRSVCEAFLVRYYNRRSR
jgi:DNA excision repair protein ERCC-4